MIRFFLFIYFLLYFLGAHHRGKSIRNFSLNRNVNLFRLDFANYDDQPRLPRQHSMDRANDYMSAPPPGPTNSSSNSYSQNYGLSRSVTLPESQHQSRRSHSYNIPTRPMGNENDMQQDGERNSFILISFPILFRGMQIVIVVVVDSVDQVWKQLGKGNDSCDVRSKEIRFSF